jgi:very-short-patch-repair endonuclease
MTDNEFKNIIINSSSVYDVSLKLYGYCNQRTIYEIKKKIIQNNIPFKKINIQRKYSLISKKCPVCEKNFETRLGHKREKTVCSKSCSNAYFKYGVNNPNFDINKLKVSNEKRSQTLKANNVSKKVVNKEIKKSFCPTCNNEFILKRKKQVYCSNKCSIKSEDTKKKFKESMNKRIENGLHKGWQSRNIISFPEKFFTEVLNNNDIPFLFNHPISQKTLGLNSNYCFFLDFYISELKLDLEIDGNQHNHKERIIKDQIRDEALIKNGYIVYRIKWKNINTKTGKEYIKNEIDKFLEYYKTLSNKSAEGKN